MKFRMTLMVFGLASLLAAQEESLVTLPRIEVASGRVANPVPAGGVAMPVSALRFEPLLDVQARNTGEGQSDVTIRGGIFENTGFQIGGVPLYDPQTGHYFAEIPVPPSMLGQPRVLTGADNASAGFNANVGTVACAWQPISTRGAASAGAGTNRFERQGFYQGWVTPWKAAGRSVAVDTDLARSSSAGTLANGDHHFSRAGVRLQLAGDGSQTDLFYGYQSKFFGWPNLYTPFGVNETERLQSALAILNHREDLGGGDFVEFGGYFRRNKDDYEYSREHPGLYNPYQHTTWVRAVALNGRQAAGPVVLNYSAQVMGDDLRSTSLTAGTFHSRTLTRLSLLPEKSWTLSPTQRLVAKAGATLDDSSRDSAAVSPVAELALEEPGAGRGGRRTYVSFARTTQVPTYTALNSSATSGLFRGNPALGRERADNIEFGHALKGEGWSLQAAAFFRRERGLVDWTFTYASPAARRANAVDIDTVGLEWVATWDRGPFRLVLGYMLLDKDADYRGARVDASFYALNYARHRFTAAIVARLGRGFELRMDNAARIQNDNKLRRIGGDETLLSSAGLYFMPRHLPGLELSLCADNLWNSNFEEVPAVPAADRQLSAGVAWRW